MSDQGPVTDDDPIGALVRLGGPRPAVSEERRTRVRAAVREAWRADLRARRATRRACWALGLAALLVLVLARSSGRPTGAPRARVATVEHVMGFVRLGSEPLEPTGDLAAGTLLETGEGRAGLLLLGGTALRLDTWTRVRLDGPGRISLDRGAIYLDSGEAGRGVAVVTAEGVVRDLGTRFEVRSAAGTLRVRVRAGAVVIERADGRGERADAGTETTVRDGRLTRRAFSPADPEWGWTLRASPGFVLEGRSLADFLDWVSRETGRSWRLAEGAERRSPSTIVLHGSVAGMSPDEGLAAVLPTCGLTHRVREGVIEVVPAEGESSSDGPPAAPEAP